MRDILWNFITKTNSDYCCRCGEKMERSNFSVEHLIPWLDSDDPVKLFFDMENISFSHYVCNNRAARRPTKVHANKNAGKRAWEKNNRVYDPVKRKEQYKRTGK